MSLLIILFTLTFSAEKEKRSRARDGSFINLSNSKYITSINVGSKFTYTDGDNIMYIPDAGFSENSQNVNYSTDPEYNSKKIKYTDDPMLYFTERHAKENLIYSISLKKEGYLVIILKFCEIYFQQPNKRVFDILFGNQIVTKDLDIFKEVGNAAAYNQYIEIRVEDQQIYFNNKLCVNAYNNGNLILTLKKKKDNPLLNAIVVYNGRLSETDANQQEEKRRNWLEQQSNQKNQKVIAQFKEKIEKYNKKKRISLRNDHQELEDDYEDIQEEIQEVKIGKTQWIKQFIQSPIGVLSLFLIVTLLYRLFYYILMKQIAAVKQ